MSNVNFSSADHEFTRSRARFSLLVICIAAIFAFIVGYALPVAPMKKALVLDAPATFAGRLVVIGER